MLVITRNEARVILARNFRIIYVLVVENEGSEYVGHFGKFFDVFIEHQRYALLRSR